ncbi:universal stress protein [Shewanella schlegeliana]|uniref:Universal stress protein n=1 Tax=Shewanella schlegeliana TaxID=190308 RepID=A0ABS1T0F9_9GAMM|nr:universal stress protein [Shewanella schlegeliana]MBL4913322.1 universal stress protein [Shewanella schlegeliana]MCL1109277.1 universal stress protein [Shewanella schlegeliana]GIU24690.1 universal stress protein [Shewanella schlegeliana]
MKVFKKILFVSQGLPSDSDSIGQALRLSQANNAQVKGLIVCPAFSPSSHKINTQYQDTYENALRQTVNQQIDKSRQENHIAEADVPLPLEVFSGEKPAVNIIKNILQHEHDLLIKDAEPLDGSGEGFKALDMTLLRKCPCPVWLNRLAHQPLDKRQVAVAIDPISTSLEENALSIRMLQLARDIANRCDYRLHILSCWEYKLESYLRNSLWIKIDQDELDAELDASRVNHRKALDSLIEQSGIGGDIVIHHLQGAADVQIPQFINEKEIDILVMGTLARTGIPGFVIGNTAENILQSIKCSLVALKPEGFKSPIS